MKLNNSFGWSSAVCLCAFTAQAQETNETAVTSQQVQLMQEKLEKQQQEISENSEHMIRDQQAQIEALKKVEQERRVAGLDNYWLSPSCAPPAVNVSRSEESLRCFRCEEPAFFRKLICLVPPPFYGALSPRRKQTNVRNLSTKVSDLET